MLSKYPDPEGVSPLLDILVRELKLKAFSPVYSPVFNGVITKIDKGATNPPVEL